MKYSVHLLALILLFPYIVSSQEIRLEVSSFCPDLERVHLYRFGGLHFEHVMAADIVANKAIFTLPRQEWQFYYLGDSDADVMPVILGQEELLTVKFNCGKWSQTTITDSPIHRQYNQLKNTMNKLKSETNKLTRAHFSQLQQGQIPELFLAEMTALDQEKLALLDTYREENPFFYRVLALNTYLSYFIDHRGHENEMDYFAGEYFRFITFEDPALNYFPWVYESFRDYAKALADTKMPEHMLYSYINGTLDRIPATNQSRVLALSGVIAGLEKDHPESYAYYATLYADTYEHDRPELARRLRERSRAMAQMIPGAEAPDFVQLTPSGEELNLHSLRGRVLLVDFWASWCGPCRRDNPHIRQLFHKYKHHGFDILGVSLDTDRNRWLEAIEKDGLTWHQVSDLKGWRNEAGQLYSVTSIPHTVLLDKEGRIIARKLRGGALEDTLKEIFGF